MDTETLDAQDRKQREDQCLSNVWLALRGVAMGAPLDADYAKNLATELRELFIDTRS